MVNKKILEAALIRALWTAASVVVSMLAVNATIYDVDWKAILGSVSIAALTSFLKSILVGMPETATNGMLIADNDDPDVTKWTLRYDGDPNDLSPGDRVTFSVVEGHLEKDSE